MDRLKNKKAIILGATSGMGESMAYMYAKEGAEIIFTGRREEKGKAIESSIIANGGKATFVKADSTKTEDLEHVFKVAEEILGRIDILINNAGVAFTGPLEEITMETYDKIMNLNVRSYYEAIQMVLPIMKKQGFGNIINTASIGGLKGLPLANAYCASKAAVRLLTKSLAVDIAEFGIRINSICPGTIDTEMLAGVTDEYRALLASGVPMKSLGSGDDIAYGAVYLGSDESGYVTGADLVIDGGISL